MEVKCKGICTKDHGAKIEKGCKTEEEICKTEVGF
jgi:hypothetical protein